MTINPYTNKMTT